MIQPKRIFRFFLILSLVALVVVPIAAQDEEVPGGPITWNSYTSEEPERQFDQDVITMWLGDHAEAPVIYSNINHEDFKQALRAYLVANPAPDVLNWFAGNRARFFIDQGQILDISDVWEESGFVDSYPAGFQAMSSVDGNFYFLPTSYYSWGIYYRPSLFEAAGIEAVPETWDDLLAACDTFNEAGLIPITIGTRFRWTWAGWFDYINMRLNGPEFHIDLMLLNESYTDERVKAVFEKWEELFDHNCFIEDPAAYSWQEALDPMIQGDAAMYLIGDFMRGAFPDDLEEDLDFFQFPIIDPDVPIGEDAPTDGYFIAANARNPEGAKAFLAFLGSAEVQQLLVDNVGRLPTNSDADTSNLDRFQQKGVQMLGDADYIAQFYDRDTTPPMADVGMDGFMAFYDNPADIDSILEDLEAERVRLVEEGQE
jgi:multiple sugar transport system substrate-binding protein/raffinose/stachyose/melibiose transport system substrate-binding protein